ncbi:uncharacterized protein LOC142223166 [Haematobia irritans]|uniref:uncharacterized protein LOC142223166 n=1 Tax=Haematobia irritans TaxID=7368 RepID=UPI003F4FB8D8
MVKVNNFFQILLLIQISCVVWSLPYGNPDAEFIDVGHKSSSAASRDQFIIDAAIRRGMDGEAVAELLRTKKPVVRVKLEPNGTKKTTTYSLDPDGSISSKTITEAQSFKRYDSGSLPEDVELDDILKSPTGTVTKTYTDKDGATVRRTFTISKPETRDDDWTKPHTRVWSSNPTFPWSDTPKGNNLHKTISTYIGPNGEKRVVEKWSSDPEITIKEPKFPSTKWPQDVEEVPTTFQHRPNQGPEITPPFNWPSYNFPDFSHSWPHTNYDSDEWTVVQGNPSVETTTKRKFQSWTPKTLTDSETSSTDKATTTTTTTTTAKPVTKVTTPFPSLDDFLKSQYGPAPTTSKATSTTTSKPPSTTTSKTSTTRSKTQDRPTTPSTTKKPVMINIEDLPVTHVLQNGKPIDESLLKQLPPHLTPKFDTGNVLKIENKYPINPEPEHEHEPESKTTVRTISKTHVGPSKPTIEDLDPEMQEILRKAGISPVDISSIDGDTITKTRKEPDGRVVTTTYKLHSTPSTNPAQAETPTFTSLTPPYHHKPLEIPNLVPSTFHSPFYPVSPISEFLSKFGLTKADIWAKNGEYTRTIIDDDGQVLTATFVLSSPIRTPQQLPEKKPYK